nr:PREDICTED: protein RRP5 homolog [Latimeria chalumnae]|eukprot:XP_014349745.1 PREDICTED: protein RRP5 homolog [Latimeria chalumnae]
MHPDSKTVGLTLHPQFLQPGRALPWMFPDRIGEVVERCVVKGFQKATGVTFELDGTLLAFAHKKHLSDTEATFNPGLFTVGSKHTCRIIDYSPMDQMALVSLKK